MLEEVDYDEVALHKMFDDEEDADTRGAIGGLGLFDSLKEADQKANEMKAEMQVTHKEHPNAPPIEIDMTHKAVRGAQLLGEAAPEVLLTQWFVKYKGKYKNGLNKPAFVQLAQIMGPFLNSSLWRALHFGVPTATKLTPEEEKEVADAKTKLRRMKPLIGMSFAEATFTVTYESKPGEPPVKQKRNFVVVRGVQPHSPAAISGVRVDDLLLEVNGTTFSKPHDYFLGTRGAKPGDEVPFKIQRQAETLTIPLIIGAEGVEQEEIDGLRTIIEKEERDLIPWEPFHELMSTLIEKQDKISLLFRILDLKNQGSFDRADLLSVLDEGYHSEFVVIAGNEAEAMQVSVARLAAVMADAAAKESARNARGTKTKQAKAAREVDMAAVEELRTARTTEEDKLKHMVDEVFKACKPDAQGRIDIAEFRAMCSASPQPWLIWWMGALNFHGAATREHMRHMLMDED